MHYPINKQDAAGFTLIELVVVIIVLGILAVIAAPKFIGLSKEARVQTLSQLQASVKTANTLAYSKNQMPSLRSQAVAGRDDIIDIDLNGDGTPDTRLNGVISIIPTWKNGSPQMKSSSFNIKALISLT